MEPVSVIIVNWNTGKLLKECLESIENLPERGSIRHIVIVDNASNDTSLAQAKIVADRLGCTFLLQHENIGFAKANNIGIRYIQEHGGLDDHILLLNPDTTVHPNAIENMINVLVSQKNIGVVGPKLLEPTGDTQPSVRSFPTFSIFALLFLKLHRVFSYTTAWKKYTQTNFDYDKQKSVDQVMGAAFLIHTTILQKIGLLDENFWIWFEEVDYCKRVQDAGFEVVYTPDASLTHYKGTSFNQLVGIKKTKPFLDSSLHYAKKHLGIGAYVVLLILYPVAILIAIVASFNHLKQQAENNKKL